MSGEEKKWQHWDDLPPEKEGELLNFMANFFVDNNLGLLAQIMLESGEPITKIISTLGMGLFGPYLEFFGVDTVFAFFRKEGNTRQLIDRINKLEDDRKDTQENKQKKE